VSAKRHRLHSARVTNVGTAKPGALPNLIVIGVAQCGTSALHYYLDLHPEIQMSRPKELNFFISSTDVDDALFPPIPALRPPQRPVSNWDRGAEWYASQFQATSPIRGESSVSYTLPWCPRIAERMASVVPEAKLILMVRDPVERLVSQYLNYRDLRRERRPLEEAVCQPHSAYVARSSYVANLRPFLERFPRSSIHIERQEDLLERRRATMRRIFAFLEVDDDFWSLNMERLRNTSRRKGRAYRLAERLRRRRLVGPLYRLGPEAKWRIERLVARREPAVERPAVGPALRRRLVEKLEGDIVELEELTGWDLSAWRAA
jgi:Sulfotransferase family